MPQIDGKLHIRNVYRFEGCKFSFWRWTCPGGCQGSQIFHTGLQLSWRAAIADGQYHMRTEHGVKI